MALVLQQIVSDGLAQLSYLSVTYKIGYVGHRLAPGRGVLLTNVTGSWPVWQAAKLPIEKPVS